MKPLSDMLLLATILFVDPFWADRDDRKQPRRRVMDSQPFYGKTREQVLERFRLAEDLLNQHVEDAATEADASLAKYEGDLSQLSSTLRAFYVNADRMVGSVAKNLEADVESVRHVLPLQRSEGAAFTVNKEQANKDRLASPERSDRSQRQPLSLYEDKRRTTDGSRAALQRRHSEEDLLQHRAERERLHHQLSKDKIRPLWRHYYRDRAEDAKEELRKMSNEETPARPHRMRQWWHRAKEMKKMQDRNDYRERNDYEDHTELADQPEYKERKKTISEQRMDAARQLRRLFEVMPDERTSYLQTKRHTADEDDLDRRNNQGSATTAEQYAFDPRNSQRSATMASGADNFNDYDQDRSS